MGTMVENFGLNAGKIWKALEKYGPLHKNKLMKTTGLKKEDFYTAIGWLAKENKICFKESTYCLGESNFDYDVGKDAGKIWDVLYNIKEMDDVYLPKLAGLSEEKTYCAVGWLAKEGKISAKKIIPKKARIKFEIK